MTNRTIQQVKQDSEHSLLAIPGVMGVGISLTKDKKTTCIKVYLSSDNTRQLSQIPSSIEGYPVEIEIRGIFHST